MANSSHLNKEKEMTEAVQTETKQDFQALDTTIVQVRSVLNFMYTLGYTLDEEGKTGRFITKAKSAQGNRYLSFATAAKLHNMPASQWAIDSQTGQVFPEPIHRIGFQAGFTAIGVRLAIASKLVEEVKLSVTRTGQVKTQDVMIKPLNRAVLQLVEE
jgi:hypothetical protein